ncbi:MAG: class I SAM-dependent methyltransferase [Spirochaetales bacterium]|nr:class I SAM-dependent methyltransferase [Spirochaetales bacterium]
MREMAFEEYYKQANQAAVKGWEFSFLDNRWLVEDLPWDYKKIVQGYLKKANRLLDIETGGGELLSDFKPLPSFVMATENYKPNVMLAKQRLEPFGIQVVKCNAELTLPFADNYFDLVINRHGSLNVAEVLRVLQKNGIFITQQVGAQDNIQLNHFFNDTSRDNMKWDLAYVIRSFKNYDIEVIKAEEHYPETVFKDIGAVIYYLRVIQWQIADFDIKKNKQILKKLYVHIMQNSGFETTQHRF